MIDDMWIARDNQGPICLYNTKPSKNESGYWYIPEDTGCGDNPAWEYLQLIDDFYDNMTSDDEPIEVGILPKSLIDIILANINL